MKLPMANGIWRVRVDQSAARECYIVELHEAKRREKEKNMWKAPHFQEPQA